jgi:hypothetical protein
LRLKIQSSVADSDPLVREYTDPDLDPSITKQNL